MPRVIEKPMKQKIYFVEFLRIFLILSVFLTHLGDLIDAGLKDSILSFFHTKSWRLGYATDWFFVIGGFFLYRRIAKAEGASVVAFIGKLWIRLMPGIIFCHVILVLLGVMKWWDFPFLLFPAAGTGFSREMVGYSDWFIGVYFTVSCLYFSLFAVSRRSAWLWLCGVMVLCWCILMNDKPAKGIGMGGMHYGALADGTVRGLSCMALGMVAAHLSNLWNLKNTLALRITATIFEAAAVYVLFCYMYCPSRMQCNPIAVDISVAALLISAERNWGGGGGYFESFQLRHVCFPLYLLHSSCPRYVSTVFPFQS